MRAQCASAHTPHLELVRLEELGRRRLRRPRHPCQLVIKPEEHLECDAGRSARLGLHIHPFLRLDCLVDAGLSVGRFGCGFFG